MIAFTAILGRYSLSSTPLMQRLKIIYSVPVEKSGLEDTLIRASHFTESIPYHPRNRARHGAP